MDGTITLQHARDGRGSRNNRLMAPTFGLGFILMILAFLGCGPLLRQMDGQAAVLDIGALSLLVFALAAGLGIVVCSLWLQELLWRPLRSVRQEMVGHLNTLTSWQKLILYFAVFFLWLYAWVWIFTAVL